MTALPVEGRQSFRMTLRRSTPIMTLKLATRNWTNKLGMPAAWEGAVLALMRKIEQTGLVVAMRLAALSPSVAASALTIATQRGPARKLVSVYRRSSTTQMCHYFFGDSKSLCGIAYDKYHNHQLRDANKMYLEAMKTFQKGIDCYSARVARVLTRDTSPSASLGLSGLSSGEEEGTHDWLQEYRKASAHSFRLRLQSFLMWYTLKRLEKAVDHLMTLTAQTEAEAIQEASTEAALSIVKTLEDNGNGSDSDDGPPRSPFEEAMKAVSKASSPGVGNAVDDFTLQETARLVGGVLSGLAAATGNGQEQPATKNGKAQEENDQPQAETAESVLGESAGLLGKKFEGELQNVVGVLASRKDSTGSGGDNDKNVSEGGETPESTSTDAAKSSATADVEKTLADVVEEVNDVVSKIAEAEAVEEAAEGKGAEGRELGETGREVVNAEVAGGGADEQPKNGGDEEEEVGVAHEESSGGQQ